MADQEPALKGLPEEVKPRDVSWAEFLACPSPPTLNVVGLVGAEVLSDDGDEIDGENSDGGAAAAGADDDDDKGGPKKKKKKKKKWTKKRGKETGVVAARASVDAFVRRSWRIPLVREKEEGLGTKTRGVAVRGRDGAVLVPYSQGALIFEPQDFPEFSAATATACSSRLERAIAEHKADSGGFPYGLAVPVDALDAAMSSSDRGAGAVGAASDDKQLASVPGPRAVLSHLDSAVRGFCFAAPPASQDAAELEGLGLATPPSSSATAAAAGEDLDHPDGVLFLGHRHHLAVAVMPLSAEPTSRAAWPAERAHWNECNEITADGTDGNYARPGCFDYCQYLQLAPVPAGAQLQDRFAGSGRWRALVADGANHRVHMLDVGGLISPEHGDASDAAGGGGAGAGAGGGTKWVAFDRSRGLAQRSPLDLVADVMPPQSSNLNSWTWSVAPTPDGSRAFAFMQGHPHILFDTVSCAALARIKNKALPSCRSAVPCMDANGVLYVPAGLTSDGSEQLIQLISADFTLRTSIAIPLTGAPIDALAIDHLRGRLIASTPDVVFVFAPAAATKSAAKRG